MINAKCWNGVALKKHPVPFFVIDTVDHKWPPWTHWLNNFLVQSRVTEFSVRAESPWPGRRHDSSQCSIFARQTRLIIVVQLQHGPPWLRSVDGSCDENHDFESVVLFFSSPVSRTVKSARLFLFTTVSALCLISRLSDEMLLISLLCARYSPWWNWLLIKSRSAVWPFFISVCRERQLCLCHTHHLHLSLSVPQLE